VLNWFGMFAPAGTPAPIVARMHAEAKAMLTAPAMTKRLANEGAQPIASTPREFAAFVKSEIGQWSKVGRAAKIQPAG
jgi:tripartite-type tricarboxylate transporter receptor subunit TctC